jgi:hypothetical protein
MGWREPGFMKGWFAHRSEADPVWLAEELPGPGKPITLADRACCCPARPVVSVILPPAPGRLDPVDLFLCGHHYRTSRAALAAAGAEVYDERGLPIADGARRLPGQRTPWADERGEHATRHTVYGA